VSCLLVRLSAVPARREHASLTIIVLCAALIAGCGQQRSTRARATTDKAVDTRSVAAGTRSVARKPRVQAPDRSPPAAARRQQVTRPAIVRDYIPFGAQRRREMAAYARRHYGLDRYRLIDPRVIVEHFTVTDSVQATVDIFAPDVADPELHELPGVCSHFVIAKDGTIHQLVALGVMCRHTVGLNYTAIGIEHVGRSDAEILDNPRQLAASLRLTTWLRCRLHIRLEDVIGHNESLTSPYHRENIARLRSQTHEDFTRAHMQVYRRKLRRLPCA